MVYFLGMSSFPDEIEVIIAFDPATGQVLGDSIGIILAEGAKIISSFFYFFYIVL